MKRLSPKFIFSMGFCIGMVAAALIICLSGCAPRHVNTAPGTTIILRNVGHSEGQFRCTVAKVVFDAKANAQIVTCRD